MPTDHPTSAAVPSDEVVPPTRVLFVSHAAELGGGAERSLVELVAGLSSEPGIDCLVAARRKGAVLDAVARAGATPILAPTPGWVIGDPWTSPDTDRTASSALRTCLRVVPRWMRVLRQQRPDVLVTSTSTIPSAALAARILGIPHLWFVTELLEQQIDRRFALGPRWTAAAIDRLSDNVLVTSEAVADSLPGVARVRTRVISPSCALPPAPQPPPVSDACRPLQVLLLARFERGKGAETAIAAVDLARRAGADIELRLVGPGPAAYLRRLRRQSDQSSARDRISWGSATDDPAGEIDRADVVLSATTIDSFGRVTAEAMRRGRPVVGAAAGGTVELVQDGINGILFPPDDVPALAAVLDRLASDRAEVARLAAGAWETGRTNFLPERRVALFRAALAEL